MLQDDVRNLWTEPRSPGAPGRVWRDWALLAVTLAGVVLEATLRDDVVWRPVAVVLGVWLAVLTLWRRTHPLAMITLAFGAIILLQVATVVADPPEPVGLYSGMVVLVLVYALPRWGSGREVVLERFSADAVARSCEAVYHEVLRVRGGSGRRSRG